MNELRKNIKRILEQEVGSNEWIDKKLAKQRAMSNDDIDKLGKNVLDLYKDKFTVDYFLERIPFLKDYNIILEPGKSPYDDRKDEMQYNIRFGLKKASQNQKVNIGGTYADFDKIFMFSDFTFHPYQNRDVVFYKFLIKNRLILNPAKTEDQETNFKIKIFTQAALLISEKLSYYGEIMISGDKDYFFNHRKNEYEFNDPTNFPEDKLDNIINEINKALFNFEEFISNFDLKIEK
jgi:hypothetical protein